MDEDPMDRRSILPLAALAVSVALLPMTFGIARKAALNPSSDALAGSSVSCALDKAGGPVCWNVSVGNGEGRIVQGKSIFCRMDHEGGPVCDLSQSMLYKEIKKPGITARLS
jgi:hypothetical protein